jgi:tetratricopeptide (TPR) repeat protein
MSARLITSVASILLTVIASSAAERFQDKLALENEAYNRGDYVQALKIVRPFAEAGDRQAQYSLAFLYSKALNLSALAVKWYVRSAAQNESPAQLNLAQLFFYGIGTPSDYAQAYWWASLAVRKGDLIPKLQEAAASLRDRAAGHLAPSQIAQLNDLVQIWAPYDADISHKWVWCEGDGNPSLTERLLACSSLIDLGQRLTPNELARALNNRAVTYSRHHRHLSQAIRDIEEAIRLDPNSVSSFRYRGLLFFFQTDFTHAIEEFTEAIKRNSNEALALANRAYSYIFTGDDDRALDDYRAALRIDPNLETAYVGMTVVYSRGTRAPHGFIEELDQIIHRTPDSAVALAYRCGFRMKAKGDLQLALSDCDEALRLDPTRESAMEFRGLVHLNLGRFDEAMVDFSDALDHDARNPTALFGRGIAKQRIGDNAGALADMSAAKALYASVEGQVRQYYDPN